MCDARYQGGIHRNWIGLLLFAHVFAGSFHTSPVAIPAMWVGPTGPSRPGKSYKSSSSGKFRMLQCPQNSVIRDKDQIETRVLNFGVVWWNPQILIVYPQSIALHPLYWIQNSSFSSLLTLISLSNLNSPTSTHLPRSSIKSTRYLIQKVLKIAQFPTKCPQAPLAPLATFSRSGSPLATLNHRQNTH